MLDKEERQRSDRPSIARELIDLASDRFGSATRIAHTQDCAFVGDQPSPDISGIESDAGKIVIALLDKSKLSVAQLRSYTKMTGSRLNRALEELAHHFGDEIQTISLGNVNPVSTLSDALKDGISFNLISLHEPSPDLIRNMISRCGINRRLIRPSRERQAVYLDRLERQEYKPLEKLVGGLQYTTDDGSIKELPINFDPVKIYGAPTVQFRIPFANNAEKEVALSVFSNAVREVLKPVKEDCFEISVQTSKQTPQDPDSRSGYIIGRFANTGKDWTAQLTKSLLKGLLTDQHLYLYKRD